MIHMIYDVICYKLYGLPLLCNKYVRLYDDNYGAYIQVHIVLNVLYIIYTDAVKYNYNKSYVGAPPAAAASVGANACLDAGLLTTPTRPQHVSCSRIVPHSRGSSATPIHSRPEVRSMMAISYRLQAVFRLRRLWGLWAT